MSYPTNNVVIPGIKTWHPYYGESDSGKGHFTTTPTRIIRSCPKGGTISGSTCIKIITEYTAF